VQPYYSLGPAAVPLRLEGFLLAAVD